MTASHFLRHCVLSQSASIFIRAAPPKDWQMSELDETFTIKEMREAYIRFVQGLPLTEKQKRLAEAKHVAVHAIYPAPDKQE